jgi:hypothetical protein
MKKVKWADFKLTPMRFVIGEREIKVMRGDQSYFLVQYVSPYVEDKVTRIKKKQDGRYTTRNHRCSLCRSVKRVVYVIPFDGAVSPGWYCYKCRKTNNLLDVKRAKRYGKIC